MKAVAAALVASALVVIAAPAATMHRASPSRSVVSEQAFRGAMDKLWEQHVAWTRMAIVSFAAGLPNLKATEARLLRHQTDLATRSSRTTAPLQGRS